MLLEGTLLLLPSALVEDLSSNGILKSVLDRRSFWINKLQFDFGFDFPPTLPESFADEVDVKAVHQFLVQERKKLSGLTRPQFHVQVLKTAIRSSNIDVIKTMMEIAPFKSYCNNSIVYAAKHEKITPLLLLLTSSHADIAYRQHLALRASVRNNKVESAKYLLLSQKCNSNANNSEPLTQAIKNRNVEMIDHILSNHLTVTTPCIISACECEDLYIFQQIIGDERSDLNHHRQEAFTYCVENHYIDAAIMIARHEKFNPQLQSYHSLIISQEHVGIVEALLTNVNFQINFQDGTKVMLEALKKRLYLFFELAILHPKTKRRFDPNVLLVEAVERESFDIAGLLLQCCQFTTRGLHEALIKACFYDHYRVVEYLLKHPKVDPSFNHHEAMRVATRQFSFHALIFLLGDGRADPTIDDNVLWKSAKSLNNTLILRILEVDGRVKEPERSLKT
ncbi:Hypothetical protein POVR1_LOCUS206 [uncultured virus]|nr:Hypothetical protein POVR1_LOCUS206 [uncultured virus]